MLYHNFPWPALLSWRVSDNFLSFSPAFFIRHFRKKHSEDVAATVPDDLNESYDDQDGGEGDITGR
jgi:hypothetical protein